MRDKNNYRRHGLILLSYLTLTPLLTHIQLTLTKIQNDLPKMARLLIKIYQVLPHQSIRYHHSLPKKPSTGYNAKTSHLKILYII